MQSGIGFTGESITGESKYIETVTSFDMSKGHNFLALHISSETATEIKVGMNPTQGSGLVTLDESGIVLLQIGNNSQKVRVQATDGTLTNTVDYSIAELILDAE